MSYSAAIPNRPGRVTVSCVLRLWRPLSLTLDRLELMENPNGTGLGWSLFVAVELKCEGKVLRNGCDHQAMAEVNDEP